MAPPRPGHPPSGRAFGNCIRRSSWLTIWSARAKPEKLGELAERLATDAFVDLEPFGRALTKGLRGARIEGDGVLWEEEDYCAPPLAEERVAVLDSYFDGIAVEPVAKGEGWRRIEALPHLFADLQRR
jgi:hypothetical protein